MADISTKPYLIRAIHEWCTDSGYRPYIAVVVDENTVVPREFVRNGEIVLNVSSAATNRLRITNELIEFEARFGGVPRSVSVPMNNVSAIYAQETGHGMAFEVPKALALAPSASAPRNEGDSAQASDEGGSTHLREVDPVPSGGAEVGDSSPGSSARRSASHSRRPRLSAVPSGKRSHLGSDVNGKDVEPRASEGGESVEAKPAPDAPGAADPGGDKHARADAGADKNRGADAGGDKDPRVESGNGKPARRRRKDVSGAGVPEPGSGTDLTGEAVEPARRAPNGKTEAGGSEVLERNDASGGAAGTGARKAASPKAKARAPASEETRSDREKDTPRGDDGQTPPEDRQTARDDGQTPPDDAPPSPSAGRPRLRRVK